MSDPEKLRELVDQLHQQLEEAEALDEQSTEQLQTALEEIRAALDRNQASDQESVGERLEEATAHFEQSHPTIATTLERLVDMLGQMGI